MSIPTLKAEYMAQNLLVNSARCLYQRHFDFSLQVFNALTSSFTTVVQTLHLG